MEVKLATNWNNAILYDENNQVISEWNGDVVYISHLVINTENIVLEGRISSMFVPYTEKIEILYHNEYYKAEIKWKEKDLVFKAIVDRNSDSKEEIELYVTCRNAKQKAKILFESEKMNERIKTKGFVYNGMNWMIQPKNRKIKIVENDSLVGKIKAAIISRFFL